MICVEDLKKQLRAVDLAAAAGRKRQSPRTGFLHLSLQDEAASDTIPIYENFCFALALFRLKTGEAVTEGKDLVSRLLAFQAPCGNFPIYLHEFPKCWDPLNPLKIAAIFLLLLRQFDSILGNDLKERIENSLQKLLLAAEKKRQDKPYSLLWENRFLACTGKSLLPVYRNCLKNRDYAKEAPQNFDSERVTIAERQGTSENRNCEAKLTPEETDFSNYFGIDAAHFSAQEWAEWLITLAIAEIEENLRIPYNPALEAFVGSPPVQERGEPQPLPIEWILAESSQKLTSQRLLRDHPNQIYCAALFPVLFHPVASDPYSIYTGSDGILRILWKGSLLHSLAAKSSRISVEASRIELLFDLTEEMAVCRDDLFEASLYCDFSPETELFIEGRKATLFCLGDKLAVRTPNFCFQIRFELLQGEGDFCGHLLRGNRPSQVACKGSSLYEAYDWKIGLRTLRRKAPCQILVSIQAIHEE